MVVIMKPNHKIFAAILGLNPQIVTESIFAIINDDPANAPDSVYVLSTSTGIERCIEKLINQKWLEKVYQHFSLPYPEFTMEHCITFSDKNGKPLEDIRSYQDSEDSADTIFNHIAKWCETENNQLHLSVGGGRKSLDLHAGLAMNICSKPNDCMSQVLVSDYRIENNPDFFFPNQPHKQILETPNKEKVDVRDLRVELVQIDYIRLRKSLPKHAFCSGKSRQEIIALGRRYLEDQILEIDYPNSRIKAAGATVKMSPIVFALYTWVIEEKIQGTPVASTSYQSKKATIELAIQQIYSFKKHIEKNIEDFNAIKTSSENKINEILNKLNNHELNHKEKIQQGVREWAGFISKQCTRSKTSIKEALKETSLINPYIIQCFDAEGNAIKCSSEKTGIRLDIKIQTEDIKII